MKINKIIAIALAAFTMTACSDDDDSGYNTASGVTVEMAQATFNVKENVDLFNVPFNVSGNANGMVTVTIEVKEGPANPDDSEHPTIPAKKDEDYIITSYTINVPAGENVGYIEIRNNWEQGYINDDKVFTITITDVKGAAVGNPSSCVVTLENVDDAYTMMLGRWEFTGRYLFNGAAPVDEKCILSIQTPDPVTEAEDYGSILYAYGLRGRDALYMTFSFEFDNETQTANMSVITATFASTSLFNFGFGTTPDGETIYGIPAASSEYARGVLAWGDDIPVTVSPELNEITFQPESEFYLMILPYLQSQGALMQNMGYFGGWDQMHLKKIE